MVQSVLGSLTLGYRALWGRSRALAGVQLYVAQAAQAIEQLMKEQLAAVA